jgi:hypothetical protein
MYLRIDVYDQRASKLKFTSTTIFQIQAIEQKINEMETKYCETKYDDEQDVDDFFSN